jgi:hypothetical protein
MSLAQMSLFDTYADVCLAMDMFMLFGISLLIHLHTLSSVHPINEHDFLFHQIIRCHTGYNAHPLFLPSA